jgi:hypothetical protein
VEPTGVDSTLRSDAAAERSQNGQSFQ